MKNHEAKQETATLPWDEQGGRFARKPSHEEYVPTGSKVLDSVLPGQGWPKGRLTEILCEPDVSGVLRLIVPALARISRSGQWLVWVAPPHIPYAPALASMGVDLASVLLIYPPTHKDKLWALEQTLRSGACGAVLGWLAETDSKWLRRLQLAAEAGQALGILFRSLRAVSQPSPAAVRLKLAPVAGGVTVRLLKRHGGSPIGPLHIRATGVGPCGESAGQCYQPCKMGNG